MCVLCFYISYYLTKNIAFPLNTEITRAVSTVPEKEMIYCYVYSEMARIIPPKNCLNMCRDILQSSSYTAIYKRKHCHIHCICWA